MTVEKMQEKENATMEIKNSPKREFLTHKLYRWWLVWGIFIGLGLIFGELADIFNVERFPYRISGLLHGIFLQIGSIGLIVSVFSVLGSFVLRKEIAVIVHRANRTLVKVLLAITLAFAVGEVLLRVAFPNGATFSFSDGRAMARKFEKQYTINELGSRGPDALHPKVHGIIRILVQGDSITFGQGVPDEKDLYTTRLLDSLNLEAGQRFEMTVLAKPGDEIDDHLTNLLQHSKTVDPDLIVYQWCYNDMELDKSNRPKERFQVWRKLFIHEAFYKYSYLWFFIDNQLRTLIYPMAFSYQNYLLDYYGPEDGVYWQAFETKFRDWAREATGRTPGVMVLLYPLPHSFQQLKAHPNQIFHDRIREISNEYGIVTIDLLNHLEDVTDAQTLMVSRFDAHPSIFIHKRIAAVLFNAIKSKWPELFIKGKSV